MSSMKPDLKVILEVVAVGAAIVVAVIAVLGYTSDRKDRQALNDETSVALAGADSLAAEMAAEIDLVVSQLAALAADHQNPRKEPTSPSRYYLRLISLSCERTEDSTGADEAYLKVNGRRVWASDMSDGDYEELDKEVRFAGSVSISLYDADGSSWFDSDDYLGRAYANTNDVGSGELQHRYSRDGARYVLTYQVVSR